MCFQSMPYLLLCYLCVPHKRPGARLWVQISFKYKRLLFTKQEILANFNYFSFLPLFFPHIYNMAPCGMLLNVVFRPSYLCFFGLFLG